MRKSSPPKVAVASHHAPRAIVWAQAMTELGCEAHAVDLDGVKMAAFTSDACLLLADALDPNLIANLRATTEKRAFPILCATDRNDALLDLVDDHLPEQLLANVAVPRIRAAFRIALAEEEIAARLALNAEFGNEHLQISGSRSLEDIEDPSSSEGLRILFVGRPSPLFLALEGALGELSIRTEAAPISLAAVEYAEEHKVDVVVADAVGSSDEALSFCLALRSNAGLHHIPGALLAAKSYDKSSQALMRGVTEILNAEDTPTNLALRIARLGRQKRRNDRFKASLTMPDLSLGRDESSGLFSHRLLARRLQDHVIIAEASGRPLSIGIIRLAIGTTAKEHLASVATEIAQAVHRLVRIEDMAGALDWRTFAILMPASTEAGAKAAVARVSSIIEATTLSSANLADPGVELQTNAAQFKSGESAGALLLRAATMP